MNYATYTNEKNKGALTIDDMIKVSEAIYKKEEKPLPSRLSWFTKLMNRFGWHRKYEVIVFDSSKFNNYWNDRVMSGKFDLANPTESEDDI